MLIESLEMRCLLSVSVQPLAAKPRITAQSVLNALQTFQNSSAKMQVKAAGHRPAAGSGLFCIQSTTPVTPSAQGSFTIKLVTPDSSTAGSVDASNIAPFPDTYTFQLNAKQPLNLFNISKRIGKNTLRFTGALNKTLTAFTGSMVIHTPKGTQTYSYSATPDPETITMVNFDDLPASPSGVDLGSPYEAQGIAFTAPGFLVRTPDDPSVIVPSGTNFVDLDIDRHPTATLYFVKPGDASIPDVVDYFAFNNLGLTPINGGWYNGLTATARDLNGNAIGTLTVNPVGPDAARSVFQTAIRAAGIHSIDFAVIPNPHSPDALAPIDDFSFGEPQPMPVVDVPLTTIHFDDIVANGQGVDLRSPYASSGIVFNTPGFLVKTTTDPSVIVPSGANFLDLNIQQHSTASLYFVDPSDPSVPGVVDYFAFNNAGLNPVNHGWYNGLQITTHDINGNVIGTYTVDPYGPNTARPVFQTAIAEPGIHSIDFSVIPNPYNSNALAPIDDFTFGGPASAGTPAEPITTLNFDDIPGGGAHMALGSPYASRGIVFDSPGFVVKTNNNPAVGVPSSPNFLDLSLDGALNTSLHFVDPTDASIPATVDYFAFDNAALLAPDGWYNGLQLTTRDISGNVIGVFTVDPYGPNASRPVFQLAIHEAGIHSIDFQVIANTYSINALAPVDDFAFGQPTAASGS